MLARQYYQEDPEVQAQILRLKKLFSPPYVLLKLTCVTFQSLWSAVTSDLVCSGN